MNGRLRHDSSLLDAIDVAGERFSGSVWRIVRKGRDPLKGSTLNGRWSGGDFSVLYTSCERDGALAEIGFRLSLEPIWPSRIEHTLFEINVECAKVLNLGELQRLAELGVNIERYQSFDYSVTSKIAAAASFLEFDAVIVPCARYKCRNLVIFNERPNDLEIINTTDVNWDEWRKRQ